MQDRDALLSEIESLENLLRAINLRVSDLKESVQRSEQNAQESVPAPRNIPVTAAEIPTRPARKPRTVNKNYSYQQFHRDFHLRDRVVITNKYRGRKGTEGQVTRLDFPWVHLETDSGEPLYRKYHNVEVIARASQRL